MASDRPPLYLGFDLSTQQLKVLAVTVDLKVEHEAKFDFDADAQGFDVHKGVMVDGPSVYAPVAMWLQALDVLLARLQESGLDFARVKAISGAGMQHGSVYWTSDGEQTLGELDPKSTLEAQLGQAFSYPFSPNWQDASTQAECDEFDQALGGSAQLAADTGSASHHVSAVEPAGPAD